METTTIKTTRTGPNSAAINALAIFGFIALIIVGMALAIYAARFVPVAVSNVGSAAAYLSSQIFTNGNGDADLVVVPPADVITFPSEDTTPVATSTATTTPAEPTTPTTPVVNPQPTTPVVIPVAVPASTNYHGLPDLVIENVQTGYMTSNNQNSFRAATNIPRGEYGAVRFTVANRGTNIAGTFEVDVIVDGSRTLRESEKISTSLRPGQEAIYTLNLNTLTGTRTVEIEIDGRNDVPESNERNNTRSVTIDIRR